MKTRLALAALLLSTHGFATDYLKGTLLKDPSGFSIQHKQGVTKIKTSHKIEKSLPSLESPTYVTQSNGRKYTYEFQGEMKSDGFHLEQVPTNIAGPETLTGVLRYDEVTDLYRINGKRAEFGYTKLLNGYEFDEISKKSLLFKKITAEGYTNEAGNFVINAIAPANLFAATEPAELPSYIASRLQSDGNWDFFINTINKNAYSQTKKPFRAKLYDTPEDPVKAGDNFMVFTLGGRQGDSFGTVNGHFVTGIGQVKPDLTLRGELSNAYVTNGKDILSGNTSLMNYFSHLVQGQNIYRPTYTIIAYGIDDTKLKGFRDYLEESHIRFRTYKLDITPEFNCTTETVKALESVGIEGNYKKYDNFFKGILTSPLHLIGGKARTLHYSLKNDASRFQPRPAFNSFLGVVLREDLRKKLGAKRIDYIFYPQIDSNRPVGGTALNSIFKTLRYKKLYDKYQINNPLSPEDLRPLLAPELDKIE